jgi:hypothetical protein
MPQPIGNLDALASEPRNRAILTILRTGARRAKEGISVWSPDGYVMRTHPDLTERLEAVAGPLGGRCEIVYGQTAVVHANGLIFGVGRGTRGLWLRMPPGIPYEAALLEGDVEPAPDLPPWIQLVAWRDDLDRWVGTAAEHAAAEGSRA